MLRAPAAPGQGHTLRGDSQLVSRSWGAAAVAALPTPGTLTAPRKQLRTMWLSWKPGGRGAELAWPLSRGHEARGAEGFGPACPQEGGASQIDGSAGALGLREMLTPSLFPGALEEALLT